jgi:hypothetical protein
LLCKLNNFGGIARKIPHSGINLAESNLHTSSVNL